MRVRPRRRRGALTFAIVMTLAFLISFGALAAVLITYPDAVKDRIPTSEEQMYEKPQQAAPVEERVVYVREYDSESGVLTIPEIAAAVQPSVVGVKVMTRGGVGVGTGFFLREDGYIATNYHVVDNAVSVTVIDCDGREHKAEVIGGDELTDLAVLKIEGEGYPAVTMGDSAALLVGETVVAIGTPAGLELAGTVTDGIVSAIDRNVKIYDDSGVLTKRMTLIQTNANINPGNSGGPLINDRGQVIGITTLKLTDGYDGIGFALPINGASEILNSIIDTGSAGNGNSFVTGRPIIGITGGNVSIIQGYPASGIIVATISEDYPVAKSDLAVNDIIVAVDGIRISTTAELNALLEDMNGGDTVTLTVNRGGKEIDIPVELGWE
jgi:serine protease Do